MKFVCLYPILRMVSKQTQCFCAPGYHTCSSSDYMVSGSTLNIPDSSLTASGLFVSSNCPSDDVSPPRARINTTVEGSGCPNKKSAACCLASQEPRWIQADLGRHECQYLYRKNCAI